MKNARATLRRWTAESLDGPVFFPGNGKAIPLSPDEKLAIHASAEKYIVERYRTFERSLFLSMAAAVGSWVYIFQFRKSAFTGEFWTIYAYMLLFVGLFYILYEAWRYERALLVLRKAIGHALRRRIPLSTGLDDRVVKAEPDYEKWGPIIIFGSGILFAFPFLVQICGLIAARF